MRIKIRALFCITYLLFISFALHSPALAVDDYAQSQIKRAESELMGYHKEIKTIKNRIKQYEEMAKNARSQADESMHDVDKKHWIESAGNREKLVNNLKSDLKTIEQKLKGKEAILSDLRSGKTVENTPSPAEAFSKNVAYTQKKKENRQSKKLSTPSIRASGNVKEIIAAPIDESPEYLPLNVVLGIWDMGKANSDFMAIVQEIPDDEYFPNRLEIHTENRVWKGNYHPENEIDAPAMATFSYKPKANEMNKKIPKWAREKIEGQLEWRIELHSDGTIGTPKLKTDFFPGKVEWNEDERTVDIVAKGEPRALGYRKIYSERNAQTFGAPKIFIRMPNENNPDKNMVEGIIRRQPFFIDVSLPAKMAEEMGKKISVNVKNIDTGENVTLKLQAQKSAKGVPVIYTLKKPILLARFSDAGIDEYEAPVFSQNWVLGNKSPGSRLNLSIEEGQSVEFRFQDAVASVPYYNSWVQRGIARHMESIPKMRLFNAHIVGMSAASKEAREEANQKLVMIKNYENIVRNGTLHDRQIYEVGEKYFGLKGQVTGLVDFSQAQIYEKIQMGFEESYLGVLPKGKIKSEHRDGNKDKDATFKGVVWTSYYEQALIKYAIRKSKAKTRKDAIRDIPLAIAYSLYTGIASSSNADAAYLWLFGEDIMGKKKSYGERLGAAAQLFGGQWISMKMPKIMTMPNTNIKTVGLPKRVSARTARIGKRARWKEQVKTAKMRPINELKYKLKSISDAQLNHIISDAHLPIGPSAKVKNLSTPHKNPASKNIKKLEDINVTKKPPRGGGPPPIPDIGDIKAKFKHNEAHAKAQSSYGNNVKTSKSLFEPQQHNMCNCRHTDPVFKKIFGRNLDDDEFFRLLVEYDIIHPPMTSALEFGVSDDQVMQLLTKIGFEVKYIASSARPPAEIIDAMLKAKPAPWHIRDVVIPKGQVGEQFSHSVQIQKMIRNSDGEITHIEFYNSGTGANQTLPYKDYLEVAESGRGLILYKWPKGAKKPDIIKELDNIKIAQHKRMEEISKRLKDHDEAQAASKANEVGSLDDLDDLTPPANVGRARKLDDVLADMYPNGDMPKLHVTDNKGLQGVRRAGQLDLSDEGASFSPGGNVGAARAGDYAIRIKEGSEGFVKFEEHPSGEVPIYYPSGIGNGKGYSGFIPTEHLQYLNNRTGEWNDFPAVQRIAAPQAPPPGKRYNPFTGQYQ